jgi:hypothetical protein
LLGSLVLNSSAGLWSAHGPGPKTTFRAAHDSDCGAAATLLVLVLLLLLLVAVMVLPTIVPRLSCALPRWQHQAASTAAAAQVHWAC